MASTFAADLTSILATSEAGESGFVRTFSETFDPATGANTTVATNTAARMHFGSFTVEERAGGLVTNGDTKVVVSATGLAEPTTAAKIVDSGGGVWNVRAVVKRRAAGAFISYSLAVYQ